MQTIKGIQDSIQKNEARIEAENRAAQTERDKAAAYAKAGEPEQSQAHSEAAIRHEQNSLQIQNEINDLMNQQQQLQQQITALDQKKNDIVADKDASLAQVDTEITKLRGGV